MARIVVALLAMGEAQPAHGVGAVQRVRRALQALGEVRDGGLPVASHGVYPPPHPGAVALQARVLPLAPDPPRRLDERSAASKAPRLIWLTASQQRA